MKCDTCGLNTNKRYPIILARDGTWICRDCLNLFKDLDKHYSSEGYQKRRIIHIMKSIINKQKANGKWKKTE
jgi:rhamnogalacturonyl hydrolase YesR